MKKFLFTCFLALPCLPVTIGIGSTSFLSLVAQSPGADLLHRFGDPDRGGETLPDIFQSTISELLVSEVGPTRSRGLNAASDYPIHQFSLELSGNEASVSSLPKPVLNGVEASLDTSNPQGQQEVSPAFGVGEPQFVLIYGELINPDSLAPLRVTWKENLLPGELALKDSAFLVQPKRGTFFDGVLDPRAQKFLVKIPVQSPLGTVSLELGNRSLIKKFLVFPGDSIKIGIDLQENTLVFGGPEKLWFEAQYAAFRAQKGHQFDLPRTLLEVDREAFLAQDDYQRQLQSQDSIFGARIGIYELGKDGLDREYAALFPKQPADIPGLSEVLSFADRLDPMRLDLLTSWIEASYFRNHLSTLRKYHYSMILSMGDSVTAQRALALFPEILELSRSKIGREENRDLCTPCLDLASEWALINRSVNGTSFETGLAMVLPPDLADRIHLSRGLRDLRSRGLSFEEIASIQNGLQAERTKQTWIELTSAFHAGSKLLDTEFITLEGTRTRLDELIDRPTLLYFYFSTCTHSKNYFKNYLKPFFEKHHQTMGFQVVAVSVDADKALWHSQLPDYSLPEWINLNLESAEKEKWNSAYLIQTFPRTLLVDSTGGIRAFTIGGQDFKDYSERLLSLLRSAQHPISTNQIKPLEL